MGCDIHMFKEKKIDGKWISLDKWVTEEDEVYPHQEVAEFCVDRSYEFFGALAGVRGKHRVHYSSLPSDVSEDVMINYVRYWGCDAHSAGCITKSQAINLIKGSNPCPTCNHMGGEKLSENVVAAFQEIINNLKDDERCVFWFDN